MRKILAPSLALSLLAATATAQIRLPGVSLPALPLQAVPQIVNPLPSSLDQLSELRHRLLEDLVRKNHRVIDTDPDGQPIVRDEILCLAGGAATAVAQRLNFAVLRESISDALNLPIVVLRAPAGMGTKRALRMLRAADAEGTCDFNHIYSGAGAVEASPPAGAAGTPGAFGVAPANPPLRLRVGLIDSGIDREHPAFQRAHIVAFGCGGRAIPAAHGTAVASLLVGQAEPFHGVQPEAALYAADVFCGQPTGGAVDALTGAFAWMAEQRIAVINVSLVGPQNLLLERVIAALIARGVLIVAAVGNDGPAAPPLYPASYPHVVGVTGVDAHRHVLIEAARGPQVMFASPGADLAAAAGHGYSSVRGTSFAAPFVAGLLAASVAGPSTGDAAAALAALASSAIDLGAAGRDLTYGYGLVGAELPVDPALLAHP
jgi:hypothetical protein